MSFVLYTIIILSSFYLMLVVLSIDITHLYSNLKRDSLTNASDLQNYLLQSCEVRNEMKLPQYKFYSDLISILYNCRNSFGGEIETSLFELRKNIGIDIKETRKVRELFLGGLLQSISLSLFVVVFYIYSRIIIEVRIVFFELTLIGLWSFFGLIFYTFIFKYLEKKKFKLFSSYLASFYKFKILLMVSRPINEIIDSSRINQLENANNIGHLKIRLESLVEKVKNSGKFSSCEIDFILMEIWDYFEFELNQLYKFTGFFKLLIILVFVLPCFLYSTFSLVEYFTI